MLFGKSHFGNKSRIWQSSSQKSPVLPSSLLSFQEQRQAAKTTKQVFSKSSVAILGERTLKKWTLFQVTTIHNERPAKLHQTTVQWRQSSQIPIFWASQKGFGTAWNHSSWAETLQTCENLSESELNYCLCLYFLNATEAELLFTPGPQTTSV